MSPGRIVRTETGHRVEPGVTRVPRAPATGDALMRRGRLIQVQFMLVLPADATRDQIDEWLSYELGWGSCADSNPLLAHDITMANAPILTDLGAETDKLDLLDEALQATSSVAGWNREQTRTET